MGFQKNTFENLLKVIYWDIYLLSLAWIRVLLIEVIKVWILSLQLNENMIGLWPLGLKIKHLLDSLHCTSAKPKVNSKIKGEPWNWAATLESNGNLFFTVWHK